MNLNLCDFMGVYGFAIIFLKNSQTRHGNANFLFTDHANFLPNILKLCSHEIKNLFFFFIKAVHSKF